MSKYTDPIPNYKPPKSASPETIAWIANWLNHRRKLLYNNLGGLFWGNNRNTFNLQQGKEASLWWPNRRTYINKNFYSLIENAASAKLYKHTLHNWDGGMALGLYRPADHSIHIRPPLFESEELGNPTLHEYIHAMRAKPQLFTIRNILYTSKVDENWFNKYLNDKSRLLYLLDEDEIYARMMEFRYTTKMKPSQVVDLKFLDLHKLQIKDFNLDMFKDKDLIRLFNEVAYQPNNKEISFTLDA